MKHNEYKQVSLSEFNEFVKDYPRKLTGSVVRICDPEITYVSDDTLPSLHKIGSLEYAIDKEVAKISHEWRGPNGKVDKENTGEFWTYWIVERGANENH